MGLVAKPKSDLNMAKERVRNLALEIISECDATTEFDIGAVEEAAKGLSGVKNLLTSMKKHKVLESLQLKVNKREPWNKKVETQRNFFSTKASKLEKPKARLEKPSEDYKKNPWTSSIWNATQHTESRVLTGKPYVAALVI